MHGSSNETLQLTGSEQAIIIIMYSWSILSILSGIVLNLVSMAVATRQARAIADMAAARGGGKNGVAERGREQDMMKGGKTILIISVHAICLIPTIFYFLYSAKDIGMNFSPRLPNFLMGRLSLVNFWSNASAFARTNVLYRRAAKRIFLSIVSRFNSLFQRQVH